MSGTVSPENEWISRVLGIRFAGAGAPAASGAPTALATVRPSGPPKSALMDNLAATMARAAPATAENLPEILQDMIPRFLLAIQNEPGMEAQKLEAGAALPKQDQLLSVADTLNAVMRSARRWEELLGTAEGADIRLDAMEAAERDATAQAEYEDLVGSYNGTRAAALLEQARCVELTNQLMTEFKAVQAAVG